MPHKEASMAGSFLLPQEGRIGVGCPGQGKVDGV